MVKESKHVTITNWKGHRNYECNYCKFATLNRGEFAKHLDVHIRAGLPEAAELVKDDKNYGLEVGAPTNEDGNKPADDDGNYKDRKKSKGKKAGK